MFRSSLLIGEANWNGVNKGNHNHVSAQAPLDGTVESPVIWAFLLQGPPSRRHCFAQVTEVTAIKRSLECSDGGMYSLTYFPLTRNMWILVNDKRKLLQQEDNISIS